MDPSFFLVSCLVGLLARTTAVEKMGAGLQARAGGATIQPPLPQAAGYVIVVVLGLVVAVSMFIRYAMLLICSWS